MKKFFLFILLLGVVYGGNQSYAAVSSESGLISEEVQVNNAHLTREDALNFIGEIVLKDIPQSAQYIELQFKGVTKGTKIYKNLQKIVYVNAIANKKSSLQLSQPLNAYAFYQLIGKITKIEFISEKNTPVLKSRNANFSDLELVTSLLSSSSVSPTMTAEELQKFRILQDVYATLLQDHYGASGFDKNKIIYGAIEGLTHATGDNFTTFFEPIDAKEFSQDLGGNFEGIGAYIEMEKAGILKIISPINGSPAQKGGLQAGDIITKINGKELTKDITTQEAALLVKGPAGTSVTLSILRGTTTFDVTIVREKITVKDVETRVIDNKFFYIQTRMFGDNMYEQFSQALEELQQKKEIKKVIIDLRNNPGGYLEGVNKVLGLFIPEGKPVSVIKYKNGQEINTSNGFIKINPNDYEIYILTNNGTASASEIFIGTLKDYFPKVKVIGEKTYGKGSVQTIKSYSDGSTLKYTIAKWYTGVSQTTIDKVGITPDIEVIFDKTKVKNNMDNQLNYILDNY